MAKKKIQQALAAGKICVRNCMSGEIQLHAGGKAIGIAPGQTADLTPYIKTPSDIERIGGLKELLQSGRAVLV